MSLLYEVMFNKNMLSILTKVVEYFQLEILEKYPLIQLTSIVKKLWKFPKHSYKFHCIKISVDNSSI